MATTVGHKSGLLFLCDTITKQQFLVDTRAEVSVLPSTGLDRHMQKTGLQLLAVNSSSIRSYGTRTLSLQYASNTYQWSFIIAAVSCPLLGADFLCSNSLSGDLQGKWLEDAATFLSVPLSSSRVCAPRLSAISSSTD